MAKFIGKKVSVAVGKETTRGTDAGAYDWIPKTDLSYQDKTEKVDDVSSVGNIADATDSDISKEFSEGDIGAPVKVNALSYLLLNLLGSVATTDIGPGSGAYQHDFTLQNANDHNSLTVGVADDVQDYVFVNSMLQSLSLTIDPRDYIMFTANLRGKKGATASLTPSFSTDYRLLGKQANLKLATTKAGLSGATASKIRNMEVVFEKNLEDVDIIGNTQPDDFCNTFLNVTGSMEVDFDSETFKNLDLDDTDQAMEIEILDPNVDLGGSNNPELTITFDKVSFKDWAPNYENNGLVKQTLSFKALLDLSVGSMVAIKLVNTKTSV